MNADAPCTRPPISSWATASRSASLELREFVETDLPKPAPLPGPGDKWKRPLSMGIIKWGAEREGQSQHKIAKTLT